MIPSAFINPLDDFPAENNLQCLLSCSPWAASATDGIFGHDNAKRSDKAKKRRRRELLLKQVRGEISQEAFDRQWNEFQKEGLI